MKKIVTAKTPSPKMLAALRGLAEGIQPDTYIGRPTRQRLVKFGLARWAGPTNSGGKPLATYNPTGVPGFLPFDWDQPIEITDAGCRAIGKAPISKEDRRWRTLRDKHMSPARVKKAIEKAEEVAKDLVENPPALDLWEKLTQSAVEWLLSKRPVSFGPAEHAANPTINCNGKAEKNLARAVVDFIKKEG